MYLNFVLGLILGIIISAISYKLKLLTLRGAIAVFFLAWIIFSFGQIKWTVPILSFFIFSSLISKVRKRVNPKVDLYFQKTDERDHVQVLANGGFPGILVLINQLYASELFFIAYVSAIAAVCSDTWATEIGTLFNSKTFNIINFKQIEQGISGGVSFIGFIGAGLGSILILVTASPWLKNLNDIFIIIFISGFLGSTLDSLLGATLQGKYSCNICSKIVESKFHCGNSAIHIAGFDWMDNDAVNLSTSLFGGLFSLAIASLIL